jgi:hypothetical protein
VTWKWVALGVLGALVVVVVGVVVMVKTDPTAKVRGSVGQLWTMPEAKLKPAGCTEQESGTGNTISGGGGEVFRSFGCRDDDEKLLEFYSQALTGMGWKRMNPGGGKGPRVRELGWWTRQNFVLVLDATDAPSDPSAQKLDPEVKSLLKLTLAERTFFGSGKKRR